MQLRNKRFYDALERVRNERDNLRRDSQTDPLTGLLNRGAVLEQLTKELVRASRRGAPLCRRSASRPS